MQGVSTSQIKIKVSAVYTVIGDNITEEVRIDLIYAYKILKFIYENKGKNYGIRDIAEKGGLSLGSVDKYVRNLEILGFIKVRKHGKKQIPELTEKGFEFLLLMERILGLFRK